MKKFFSILLLAIFSFAVLSCDRNDDAPVEDNDTYPVMKDITGSFNSGNNYALNQGINILSTDVILVYRDVNSNQGGSAVWEQIPVTKYLGAGRELDYGFVFDTSTVQITTTTSFEPATITAAEANSWMNNQHFRIVLIPASNAKNANVDYRDYNSVIKYFNIDESKVK